MKQATYEEAYRLQRRIYTLNNNIVELMKFATPVGKTQIKEYETEIITLKQAFNEL